MSFGFFFGIFAFKTEEINDLQIYWVKVLTFAKRSAFLEQQKQKLSIISFTCCLQLLIVLKDNDFRFFCGVSLATTDYNLLRGVCAEN